MRVLRQPTGELDVDCQPTESGGVHLPRPPKSESTRWTRSRGPGKRAGRASGRTPRTRRRCTFIARTRTPARCGMRTSPNAGRRVAKRTRHRYRGVVHGRPGRRSAGVCRGGEASSFVAGWSRYQEAVKRQVLGVSAESVFTAEAAEQMATGVARLLSRRTSPSPPQVWLATRRKEGTPPGTVYIGVKVHDTVTSRAHQFHGSPEEVCDRARRQALLDLVDALDEAT